MSYFNAVPALRAMAGEVSLNTPFGRWAQYVSTKLDAGGSLPPGGNNAMRLLMACSGQIQLSSPLGQLCIKMSQLVDQAASNQTEQKMKAIIVKSNSQIGRAQLWQWFWKEWFLGGG